MKHGHRHSPLILIEGDRDKSRGLNWRELWRNRELLYFLTWRDITLRYKQTALGALWALIYPLTSVGVFSIFFGKIAKIESDGVPYALFSFSGLLLWIYFANTIARCASSLVGNAHMLNKVYFPRLLLPAAALCPGFVDFFIASILLMGGIIYYQVAVPPLAILTAPLVLLGVAALSLGIGMFLGSLNVRYRDVNNGITFLLQMWMFATPVVYPASLISPKYQLLIGLNPMVGYVEAFRSALFGLPLRAELLTLSLVLTAVSLVAGTRYFVRVEKSFADFI